MPSAVEHVNISSIYTVVCLATAESNKGEKMIWRGESNNMFDQTAGKVEILQVLLPSSLS